MYFVLHHDPINYTHCFTCLSIRETLLCHMSTKTKGIRLESELWEKIDSCKGECCRNDFVKNAILKQLGENGIEPNKSTGNSSRPELKVARISLDNCKTWYDASW